jgi:trans-2,3-dihydro-3-hydroxyanthranilate isomerase
VSTNSPRTLPYALVDVFAEHPLEGNQLAIFTDARGLTTEQMQSLARETNLAETTFILPEDPEHEREHGVRVRIFTVQEELPFAGHPTLGTASWLYWHHPTLRGAEKIVLRLNAGNIPVRFEEPSADVPGVYGTMRQNDPVFGATHDHAEVAKVLGLALEDLDTTLPIQTVSTGMAFCIVPIRSPQVIHHLSIPRTHAEPWLASVGAKFFFCITPAEPASGADFHNRMQFYNGEDPATGSASGCAVAYLVHHGVVPSDRPTIFRQGIEILRPSRLVVQATHHPADKKVPIRDVFVSGRTIPVATGQFFLP